VRTCLCVDLSLCALIHVCVHVSVRAVCVCVHVCLDAGVR